MKLTKRIAVTALGLLAVGGVGVGVANAATTSAPAPSTSISDTATPGDTADATGAADGQQQQGDQTSPDAPGAVDGGNTQQGDQSAPDAPGAAAETPDAPGA